MLDTIWSFFQRINLLIICAVLVGIVIFIRYYPITFKVTYCEVKDTTSIVHDREYHTFSKVTKDGVSINTCIVDKVRTRVVVDTTNGS